MPVFQVTRVPLGRDERLDRFESALIVLPRGRRAAMTWPSGKAALKLRVVDLDSGRVAVGGNVVGDARDAFFDDPGRGWLLTTHRVCRLAVIDGVAEVVESWRPKGLGQHQHRLFALGDRHLGVTGWATKTLAVLDRSSPTAVMKQIRVVSPHLVLHQPDRVRLCSPHGGEQVDLKLPTLEVLSRRSMPTGTRPVLHDGKLFLLEGRRREIYPAPIGKIWRVEPERLAVYDPESLQRQGHTVAPSGARDVLAIDSRDLVVISTERGVALVSADGLDLVDHIELEEFRWPLTTHAWLPELNAVAALPRPSRPADDGIELILIRW